MFGAALMGPASFPANELGRNEILKGVRVAIYKGPVAKTKPVFHGLGLCSEDLNGVGAPSGLGDAHANIPEPSVENVNPMAA